MTDLDQNRRLMNLQLNTQDRAMDEIKLKNSYLKDLAHDKMKELKEKRQELNQIIKDNELVNSAKK